MDACLFGKNHDLPGESVGAAIGMTGEQVERVYADIDAKRKAAEYSRSAPLLVT